VLLGRWSPLDLVYGFEIECGNFLHGSPFGGTFAYQLENGGVLVVVFQI
jgi:hypothetical protein